MRASNEQQAEKARAAYDRMAKELAGRPGLYVPEINAALLREMNARLRKERTMPAELQQDGIETIGLYKGSYVFLGVLEPGLAVVCATYSSSLESVADPVGTFLLRGDLSNRKVGAAVDLSKELYRIEGVKQGATFRSADGKQNYLDSDPVLIMSPFRYSLAEMRAFAEELRNPKPFDPEGAAQRLLKMAEDLSVSNQNASKERLNQILKDLPETEAAKRAKLLLLGG